MVDCSKRRAAAKKRGVVGLRREGGGKGKEGREAEGETAREITGVEIK